MLFSDSKSDVISHFKQAGLYVEILGKRNVIVVLAIRGF